jgi:hypothetical protein
MSKYLKTYIVFVESIIAKNEAGFNWNSLQQLHRVRIGFFQHERLIHLLVTLFFGLIFFMLVLGNLFAVNQGLTLLSMIFLVMLVFYIRHYFCLENGVQKLYKLDEEIEKHLQK